MPLTEEERIANKRLRMAEYYQKNKEALKSKQRSYYENNKSKYQSFYMNNKEKLAQYAKDYRKANPDRIKAIQKNYYQRNSSNRASSAEQSEGVPSASNESQASP